MIEAELQDYADGAIRQAMDSGCQYCDARSEQQEASSMSAENKETENIRNSKDRGIGVRLFKDGAWGFCSVSDPKSFQQVRDAVDRTVRNSRHTVQNKKEKIELYPNEAAKTRIDFPVDVVPDMDELSRISLECNSIMSEIPRISKSVTNPRFTVNSKYFINSEGSQIIQNFTDTIIEMTATAHESGLTQSINITEGGRGGLEQVRSCIFKSAREIAEKASGLIDARPAKEKKGTVIMNPDFVSLLTHEILGHPSEADRVLGKEMAWAGGAWWKGKIGHKVGSESLNVFDDPTIKKSLGWYYFDDEGVRAKKTALVEEGILTGHMQSRETAQAFGSRPTGNMRATSYRFMPLIRMACTCIGNGDRNTDEMVKEVKDGYMISNMKIPSIDMDRYNWSISCQYAQKIENGEITDLVRDVIVMGTTPEFLSSIDACGNDFTVRPITNCGKGDPMQSMMMGNGGPTVRGEATVKSVR